VKLKTLGRILGTTLLGRSAREHYWEACANLELIKRLLRSANREFRYLVVWDAMRFLFDAVHPVEGETLERARAAVNWLLRAQGATADLGVSHGYFPCHPGQESGWRASYPETTGYVIPSLLEYSERYCDPVAKRQALRMAEWEIEIQMSSGAVQGGVVCPSQEQTPAIFNTGMVLHGYSAAFRASSEAKFVDAARRAGNFLLGDLGVDGHFRTHGRYVTQHMIKTYNCLCAWALYRFGEDCGEACYKKSAITIIEAALRQQHGNGWFANNCLTNPDAPLVHTIGYTLQGILEVGILAERSDFIHAVQRGLDPLLERISSRGFLHGRYFSDWEPALLSSCLTGSAQIAVVSYRLYETTKEQRYLVSADRLLNFLKALQILDSRDPGVNGAIPGSFPLVGNYMKGGYPNWATKYFLDGLLLQDRLGAR
jgi:hypothetical protein